MKTLEDIRQRCVIQDGHWLWRGSLRPDGRPNIWAPDYTKGGMQTQCGPRAVWHCSTERPIPPNWRAYGTCDERTCCNPAHVRCTSEPDYGRWLAEQGVYKGKTSRILANRAISRARSKLTPALIAEIQASPETGVALAARLNMGTSTISKARRGESLAFAGAGAGMFTGLVAANDAGKARA